MTNKEYIQTCSSEELAALLTSLTIGVIEKILHKRINNEYILDEFDMFMDYLDTEMVKPSKYLN